MTDKTKSMCSGCRDDYYNHNCPDGCWCFATAKVVERTKVGVWQNPPYSWQPQATLSCHSPDGSVWIKEDDVRIAQETKPRDRIAQDTQRALDIITEDA